MALSKSLVLIKYSKYINI